MAWVRAVKGKGAFLHKLITTRTASQVFLSDGPAVGGQIHDQLGVAGRDVMNPEVMGSDLH